MPRIKAGNIRINYIEHGSGDHVVLAVHRNLGCADWLGLVLPLLAPTIRVIAPDWRGCGDSDKPEPADDYSNYSMATHAADMLHLLDALGIERCDLYGHAAGGIICSHMLVAEPARFRKVLMLDPVTPFGLQPSKDQLGVLTRMKADRDLAFAGLATAAPTLFRPESLVAGGAPEFATTTSAVQRRLFKRLVDMTSALSDGIWFGTPHALGREWDTQSLAKHMNEMTHEHLVLYGKLDYWIPREHVERMARELPHCTLEVFPYVGHSMCIENPLLLARIFSEFFGDEAPARPAPARASTLQ